MLYNILFKWNEWMKKILLLRRLEVTDVAFGAHSDVMCTTSDAGEAAPSDVQEISKANSKGKEWKRKKSKKVKLNGKLNEKALK